MRRNNKKILLGIILLLITITSVFLVFNKKEEYKELPKVKIKGQNNKKQFALMLEKTKGSGDYQESDGELPTEGYVFNKEKSSCTDINGKKIDGILDYDYENYIALLDTSKTSYCYLYYDIEPNISYLRDKDTESHLSKGLTGGMYRYQGLYTDDVRNYICLGENCCNTEECSADTNDSMYRIIGINAQGELKVIKKTALTEAMRWYSTNKSDVDWLNSDLFHRLNDNENGTYKDSSFYNGLNQNLKNLIIKKEWMYGRIVEMQWNSAEMYKMETGKQVAPYRKKNENDYDYVIEYYLWNESVLAHIGLQYIHDYMLAYPGGNPENKDSAINSWIHLSHNEKNHPSNSVFVGSDYLLSKLGYWNSGNYNAWYIRVDGDIPINGGYNGFQGIRPVFYLSNDIELTGEGTLTSPFKIKQLTTE